MLGSTLGHYAILEKLGEGGMGVVYKARDTRLDRLVALKVLTAEALADPTRKARLVQEARAASALNHPNIVHIYDINSDAGRDFIAMEYVPGATLDRHIGRKGLPLRDALKYAVQIADALSAAHAAGIVHRDLKPGNLIITGPETSRPGQVKILDFGLAKLLDPPDVNDAATVTLAPRTEEGSIVGTVSYMSPEQAEGKKIDARSDIFSFGSVLYEMLSGHRPFSADSKLGTLSAILHQEPPPLADVPPELERMVTRCLRKDPARRYQTMGDLKVALEDLLQESDSVTTTRAAASARRRPRWPLALAAGLLVVLAVAAAWWLWRARPAAGPANEPPTRLTADSGLTTDPALSPDGKFVAYASDRAGAGNLDIWIQNVATGESNRLTRDVADEREPAFSPDSTRVAFRSEKAGGGVYVVPTIGGAARLVAQEGRRPRFSPEGARLTYYVGPIDTLTGTFFRVQVIAVAGGSPSLEVSAASHAIWTPDGKHLLLVGSQRSAPGEASVIRYRQGLDWWVFPVEGSGAPVRTGVFDALRQAGFSLDTDFTTPPFPGEWLQGEVVFSAQRGDSVNVWSIPLAPDSWRPVGPPRQLTSGTSLEVRPSAAMIGGRLRFAFASLTSTLNIWSLPLGAERAEPRQLTSTAYDAQLSASSDGRSLAFVSSRSGNKDIWLKDLTSGAETAVVSGPGDQFGPVLSPDGSKLAYQMIEKGRWNFNLLNLKPSPSAPETLCTGCMRLWDFSSDARYVLFIYRLSPHTLGVLDRSSGQKSQWLGHPDYSIVRVNFSPDDRWVSLVGIAPSGRTRIFIVPFRLQPAPQFEEWIPVTGEDTFHDKPVWSPDGNLLYFTSDQDGFRCIWAQRLDPTSRRPLGPQIEVYHSHSARRSIMNASILEQEIAALPGQLLFHLGELTGNIWMK